MDSTRLSWKDRVTAKNAKSLESGVRVRSSANKGSQRDSVGAERKRRNSRQHGNRNLDKSKKPSPLKETTIARIYDGKSIQLHNLHTSWTLYYHSPTLQDWSVTSYMEVATFNTVEEFWAVFEKFPKDCFHMGMFFFMRTGIKPTWEDEQNVKGGCWSYKIPMKHIYTVWRDMSALLIGESLSTVPMLLNGLSVSPKRGFCIIKIWGHDSKQQDYTLLRTHDIQHVVSSEVLYTPFKEKKK